MNWNKTTAVNHAESHAGSHPQGRCAKFTRKAIQAGGITLGHTYHAKDYSPMLKSAGFSAINHFEQPRVGDVIIIRPYGGGNPGGHMAISGGQEWYSDSRQRDMWAGPGYRAAEPLYTIYRKQQVTKASPLITLVLSFCGRSSPRSDSTRDVKQFYLAWMNNFTQDLDTSHDASVLLQRYVAKNVIDRLVLIDSLYEQEILDPDYLMYVQDYDPEQAPLLRAGPVHPFLGGGKVEIQLGGPIGGAPILLEMYTHWEEGHWRIYRVTDLNNHSKQPIYSTGDVTQAKARSAEIAPRYEKMNK